MSHKLCVTRSDQRHKKDSASVQIITLGDLKSCHAKNHLQILYDRATKWSESEDRRQWATAQRNIGGNPFSNRLRLSPIGRLPQRLGYHTICIKISPPSVDDASVDDTIVAAGRAEHAATIQVDRVINSFFHFIFLV